MRGAAVSWTGLLVVVAAVAAVTALPARARAADDAAAKAAARDKVREGAALFERGDFENALARFDEAFAKFPSAVIQFNRAQALRGLGRDVEAAQALEQFLAGAKGIAPERRAEAEQDLAQVRRGLGALVVACDQEGAEVIIDGRAVGTTPLAKPVRLKAGPHLVAIHKVGMRPFSRSIDLPGQSERTVRATLDPEPAVTAVVAAPDRISAPPVARPPDTAAVVATGEDRPSDLSHGGRLLFSLRADTKLDGTKGLVLVPGLAYGLGRHLELGAAALLGYYKGAAVEARVVFGEARFKPLLRAGVPVFFVDGPQAGVQSGAGLFIDLSPHLGITAEATAVYFPFAPAGMGSRWVFVPSLGTQIRL